MPISERLDGSTQVKSWIDTIPLHYEYTAGVVGEKFLRGLMDGRILAGRCDACGTTALPARMYCVECYSPVEKLVRVGPAGVVRAVARRVDESGEPQAFAFVEFPGVRGGMVHRLIGRARSGSKVRPKFRSRAERKGAISDVLGFERVA